MNHHLKYYYYYFNKKKKNKILHFLPKNKKKNLTVKNMKQNEFDSPMINDNLGLSTAYFYYQQKWV